MYGIFKGCLTIFWILDVLDLPFMQIFDTTYPINSLAWLLIWCFLPSYDEVEKGE